MLAAEGASIELNAAMDGLAGVPANARGRREADCNLDGEEQLTSAQKKKSNEERRRRAVNGRCG